MSVNVEFEPDGQHGIVAENTYLWDAAKRLGVRLPAECEGRGECDTCAVVIKRGATLLSPLTAAERERLSPERLAAGERLACQTRVERAGDLVLQPVPATEREETAEETTNEVRTEFRKMPLEQKLATLVELEAITAFQTFKALANFPFAVVEKGLDLMAGRGRVLSQQDREARRPAEHRAASQEHATETKESAD